MLVVDASVAVAACHTPMGFARDFADTSWSHPRSWRDTLPDVLNDRKDRGFRPLLDVGENELRTLGLTLSAYGPARADTAEAVAATAANRHRWRE
jgi:hypothetical protein